MIPILFAANESYFTSNGLGRLSDAISCIVTEERNGIYELEMVYPETGVHASEIDMNMFIYAKPAVFGTEQIFRIYKITKPLNKQFKVYAQHISYDLAYATVLPCSGVSASDALSSMASHATNIGSFTTWSDVSTSSLFTVDEPASFRNWIGGRQNSILDVYGGELEWDNFTVKLWAHRGTDRGLTLRYGKNITDITQEQDNDYTVTGVTPYLVDAEEKCLTLPEVTIWAQRGHVDGTNRDKALDMSSLVDEGAIREANPNDTEAQIEAKLISAMRTAATAYVTANLETVPDAAIEVSFVDLGSTEEYKDWKALFTQAGICDTVGVYFERFGIETEAKIIKTEYNVLLNRFEKLTIGKSRTNLAQNIVDIQRNNQDAQEATKKQTSAIINNIDIKLEDLGDEIEQTAQNLQQAIDDATDLITGQEGGYVVIDRDANGKPYQILIMNTASKQTATKVWRWNQAGLGYSSNGYNGTYSTAITANGAIVADFITTGSLSASLITAGILNASLIKTGILTDDAGKNWWNMSSGAFSFCNGNMFYDLNDGDFVQLQNNLSLKLNGIPLAGIKYLDVGKIADSEYVANNTNLRAIVRPYDILLSGQIVIKKAYTYSGTQLPIVYDIPVPDIAVGSAVGRAIFNAPGYTVNASTGSWEFKADPEILKIDIWWQSFATEAAYNTWAADYQFPVKQIVNGTIYGVYAHILLCSTVAKDEFIMVNEIYARYQET